MIQRRVSRFDIHPDDFSLTGQLAQIVAQDADIGFLPHGHGHGATHRLERLFNAGLAFQNFNDMKTEAAMHQAR